jgi:hypothetical protein
MEIMDENIIYFMIQSKSIQTTGIFNTAYMYIPDFIDFLHCQPMPTTQIYLYRAPLFKGRFLPVIVVKTQVV